MTYKYIIETAQDEVFEFDTFDECIITASRMVRCDVDVMWIEFQKIDDKGNIIEASLIVR